MDFSSFSPIPKGALEGIKVLDLSRVLAGPWCTQLFGDLGAQVIKIERSTQGDETRHWGPPFKGGMSAYYMCTNRNKEVLFLDFKNQDDLKAIKDLVCEADVVIENFKEDGLNKFDLDYESVKELNPNLIYCSIRGFSSEGPYKDLPGYDALIQAMSGLMSITAEPGGNPMRVGSAVSDLLTGLYAGNAILAAYIYRLKNDIGQKVEVSLFETQVNCLANVIQGFLVSQIPPKAYGTAHPNIVPYQAFKTKDHWIMIAVGNDGQFVELSKSLGLELHNQEKYKTNPQRVENREELVSLLQETFSQKLRSEWIEQFKAAKFPWGPVNRIEDLMIDPHVQAIDLFGKMSDSEYPRVKNPIQLSETPVKDYRSPKAISKA